MKRNVSWKQAVTQLCQYNNFSRQSFLVIVFVSRCSCSITICIRKFVKVCLFLCASNKIYFNILFFKEKKQFIVEFRIAIKNTKECEIKSKRIEQEIT